MEQVEGKKAVLLNFACHPTVLNGTNLKVSADFPGAIQTALKAVSYTHLDVYKRQGYRFSYRQ